MSYLFYVIVPLMKYEVFHSNIETSCQKRKKKNFKKPKPSIHLTKFVGKAEVVPRKPVLGIHHGPDSTRYLADREISEF